MHPSTRQEDSHPVKRTIATLVAALALLVACGSDAKTASTGSSGSAASSSSAAPQRIVSMSATATEMLFAIGAGKQVVATDSQSNYPKEAPKTDLSAYEPNVEAITTYKPDLVVIADDTKELRSSLQKVGIEVLAEPAAKTLEDTYTQLNDLGAKTGHRDEAAKVVSGIKDKVSKLTAGVPKRAKPLTYFHELDNTLYSVTSKTFIGELYSLAGLVNVADPADADGQTGGYPQLSAEFLVKADPDLIFLADTKCCAQTADTFATRPGFAGLKAVTNKHVVALDDDVASRWGPRVVDLLQLIIDSVKAVPAT
jgi:iron complex transport system substrate-binding protein